eukprot:303715_1
MSVHKFGTRIHNGFVNTFYHGISKQMQFPTYINQYKKGIRINAPLSTSSCFAVATHFADNNNGLIIQFGHAKWDIYSAKYFATRWLSDYSNESEYLFIQNTQLLAINNIFEAKTGCEYGIVLDALQNVEIVMNVNGLHLYEQVKQPITVKMIQYQLSKYDTCTSQNDIPWVNKYANELIETYFKNQINVYISCSHLKNFEHVSRLLLYNYEEMIEMNKQKTTNDGYCEIEPKQTDVSVKLVIISKLFPNVEEISVTQIPKFDTVALDDLMKYLDQTSTVSQLKRISLEIKDVGMIDAHFIKKHCAILRRYNIILSVHEEFKISNNSRLRGEKGRKIC